MEDCLRRGIYPFIQIWDEPVIEAGATRWRVHPFRPSNNVNNLSGLSDNPEGHGMEGFYNIRNERLMAIQRRFVGRVLDATAHYGICIYSICNEYDFRRKAPLDWQQYWIDFFRDYQRCHPRLSAPLLYTNTAVKKYMDAGFGLFPVVDWYYLEGFRLKSFGRDGQDLKGTGADTLAALVSRVRQLYSGKILINSRPTSSPDRGRKDFSNEEESRRLVWCFFMSAVHLAGFRHLNPTDKNDTEPWNHPDPDCITCTDGLASERVIQSVRTFLRLAAPKLGDMVPEADLTGEVPVFKLVSSHQIIVYFPEGGRTKVENLDRFKVIMRYDPLHPERGLMPVEHGKPGDFILRAPRPETVFFLQVSRGPVKNSGYGRSITAPGGSEPAYSSVVKVYPSGEPANGKNPLAVRELRSNSGFVNQNSPTLHLGLAAGRYDIAATSPTGQRKELFEASTGLTVTITF